MVPLLIRVHSSSCVNQSSCMTTWRAVQICCALTFVCVSDRALEVSAEPASQAVNSAGKCNVEHSVGMCTRLLAKLQQYALDRCNLSTADITFGPGTYLMLQLICEQQVYQSANVA